MRDMKPLPDRDPARAELAAAIALEAGARRDLQVAEQAAEMAMRRHLEAQSKLEELRKIVAPSGALADEFILSVVAGNPCGTAVLERSAIDARAKMTAAENDARVWEQTSEECYLAARAKAAEVSDARERVEKAARVVLGNSALVGRLLEDLEAMQSEVIARRSAMRFIYRNGELGELTARAEGLLRQDLTGLEPTPAYAAWSAVFDKLMTDPEVELPS